MYIVLVFIGVVSLRYDNAAEWFRMAKSSTYLLKSALKIEWLQFVWDDFMIKIAVQAKTRQKQIHFSDFTSFFEAILRISVSGS